MQFYWGFDWYMRHTDTKIVFPMHMWKQYEVQDRLLDPEWKYQNRYRERDHADPGNGTGISNYKETSYESQYLYRWSGTEVIRMVRAVMEPFWNMWTQRENFMSKNFPSGYVKTTNNRMELMAVIRGAGSAQPTLRGRALF